MSKNDKKEINAKEKPEFILITFGKFIKRQFKRFKLWRKTASGDDKLKVVMFSGFVIGLIALIAGIIYVFSQGS